MIKTILIVILVNLSNPNEPAALMHKAYPSMTACNAGYQTLLTQSAPENIKIAGFCVTQNDLANEK
jgi:hypothetical protein